MKIPDVAQQTRRWELLVSVRSLAEAEIAVAESIDILDFKEPLLGPLAPVDSSILREAATRFSGPSSTSVLLSAALGERDTAMQVAGQIPASFAFAKAGPKHCGTARELTAMWTEVRHALASPVELVAVAYADASAAETLEPEEIVSLAHQHGFRRILIDTFVKDGRSSVEHLQRDRLRALRHLTRTFGMQWMLAGAIRLDDLHRWRETDTQPDGFGVRGDICSSGRESEIAPQRIRLWQQHLTELQTDGTPNRQNSSRFSPSRD